MDYFYTYLWAITPVVELRGAIPIGYLHYKMGIIDATLIGIAGGVTITAASLLILPLLVQNLKYIPVLDRLMQSVLQRTRKDYSKKMKIWGEVFLVFLVAIPLPGSGAFTGSLIAYLFGIKPRAAFLLISTGIALSALLVAFLTLSGQGLWEFFTSTTEVVTNEVSEFVPTVTD